MNWGTLTNNQKLLIKVPLGYENIKLTKEQLNLVMERHRYEINWDKIILKDRLDKINKLKQLIN